MALLRHRQRVLRPDDDRAPPVVTRMAQFLSRGNEESVRHPHHETKGAPRHSD